MKTAGDTLPHELIILAYHHVARPPRGVAVRGLYVTPRQFAWQMGWLARRGIRPVTFRDLAAGRRPRGGRPPVMITFDDGARNLYHHALPVLKRRGFGAVVFPVVGDLGKDGVTWPESAEQTPLDMLTPTQVREMAAAGIEFGSHLHEHVHADRLAPEMLAEQMQRSKAVLDDLLGRETLAVAYPYGAYTDPVVAAARAAGYRYGVTTERGSNRGAPLLALKRLPATGTRWYHPLRFAGRMRRALHPNGSGHDGTP